MIAGVKLQPDYSAKDELQDVVWLLKIVKKLSIKIDRNESELLVTMGLSTVCYIMPAEFLGALSILKLDPNDNNRIFTVGEDLGGEKWKYQDYREIVIANMMATTSKMSILCQEAYCKNFVGLFNIISIRKFGINYSCCKFYSKEERKCVGLSSYRKCETKKY